MADYTRPRGTGSARGRLARRTYATNASLIAKIVSPTGLTTTKTYDTSGRLTSTVGKRADSGVINSFAYTYDAAGQRDTETGADATRTFGYDAYRQLTQAVTTAGATETDRHTYTFDPIGNRLEVGRVVPNAPSETTTYTPNSVNQYTSILAPGASTPDVPQYDANGNTTALPGQTLLYDEDEARQREEGVASLAMQPEAPAKGEAERAPTGCEASQNRLLEVVNGLDRCLYTYDGIGRRVEKQVFIKNPASGLWDLTSGLRYVYDGWRVVEELDEAYATTRSYTLGTDLSGSLEGAGGIGGLLAITTGGATRTTANYFYDGNGNVTDLALDDGGAAAHYVYSPFGERLAATGTWADVNAYQFSSKPRETINGFYYYGLRYYNPSTGRWPSRDPIGEEGGFGLYTFANNNPIVYIDIRGLSSYSYCVLTRGYTTAIGDNRKQLLGGIISIGLGNPIQRKCFYRCYDDGKDNCPDRPCKNGQCEKDHGVEILVTINASGRKKSAAGCSSLIPEITNKTITGGSIRRDY